MTWEKGRQGTGYEKLRLFSSGRLRLDAWLLRAGPGVAVPSHVDPVFEGLAHWRANVILRPAESGGEFSGDHVLVDWPRLKVFRSDRPHQVSRITAGRRLVLSFGAAVRDRRPA